MKLRLRRRGLVSVAAAVAVAVAAVLLGFALASGPSKTRPGSSTSATTGPTTTTTAPPSTATNLPAPPVSGVPPSNAVLISVTSNPQAVVDSKPSATSFVISTGVHSNFSVLPKSGDTFYAQAGTILDGHGTTPSAFVAFGDHPQADSVTVVGPSATQPLVIRDYNDNNQEQVATVQTNIRRSTGAAGVQSARGWVLQWVEITGSYSRAVTLSDNMIVDGCYIHDNGRLGVGGGGNHLIVEGSEIARNGVGATRPGFEAGGIKTVGHDVVIQANNIHDNGDPGVWTDIDASAVRIIDNTISANSFGVHIEISHGALVQGNQIRDNQRAGVMISGSDHVTITGNVIQANSGGVLGGGVDRGAGPVGPRVLDSVQVSGNTFIDTGGSGVPQPLPPGRSVRFDHNTYEGASRFLWAGQTLTFSQWQALGQDRSGSTSGQQRVN